MQTDKIEKAGWPVAEWLPSAGICRATLYALPVDAQPQSTTIGRKRLITESPAKWLARIRKRGGVTITKGRKPAPEAIAA